MRQLENICHWLTVMAPGNLINVSDLPSELKGEPIAFSSSFDDWKTNCGREIAKLILSGEENVHKIYSDAIEKELISQALKHTKGRKVEAAKILGIGRNTITRKINELHITYEK